MNQRCDAETAAREAEDKLVNERIEKEIRDREQAVSELQTRMDSQNDDKVMHVHLIFRSFKLTLHLMISNTKAFLHIAYI